MQQFPIFPPPPLKKRERLVPSRAFQPDAIPQLINDPFWNIPVVPLPKARIGPLHL